MPLRVARHYIELINKNLSLLLKLSWGGRYGGEWTQLYLNNNKKKTLKNNKIKKSQT